MSDGAKAAVLHGALIAALFALHFVLPAYHHGNLARVMVLATYAMGYNLLFGYTGLLSLGHAMFFAAGMYGMALPVTHLGWAPGPALLSGLAAGALLSLVAGALALRTVGVAFLIVTLMFAQAVYLTVLYFAEWTNADDGLVLQRAERVLWGLDLSDAGVRYLAALVLFSVCLVLSLWLVRRPFGKVLIAIRENEARAEMLGYDVFAHKLGAVVASGTMSAAAGAAYGLLFGYAGASFAGVQYSILPLLWVLLGGAGTVIGPFLGALFTFYLIDITSGFTTAYMAVVGVVLIALTLFAPQGIGGEIRRRVWRGLP
ncbi:branched-chain amino acid ABC transporter permease [Psychromarinibacter sp. C21-152]|uniref:Branched-chain amino acid ABC transporter permease n=1 Tax=Psychromarinibacter sediminicola TaxID=3033385 RepID=A0AAE3T933_9RHOB|nr:branched-chain amino acid ABC transporter permease [Psychromarinibacter sediminicola]MDF0600654.1 branched-chain amino acid ABC transporter permease [Psychromarinibacter sediminicola]